jgi:hypothetical protein
MRSLFHPGDLSCVRFNPADHDASAVHAPHLEGTVEQPFVSV